MRIILLSNNNDPRNGWGRYASELATGLMAKGHEVRVLTEASGELRRGFGIIGSARAVRHAARGADIVHALDVYPFGVIAWLASLFGGSEYAITLIGTYSVAPFYHVRTAMISRRACANASGIIAISTYTADVFRKAMDFSPVTVITPGIDVKRWEMVREPAEPPFLLSVGAVKPRKGYHIAIPAFARARANVPGLRYVIIGDQSDVGYARHLRELAVREGVSDAVTFLDGVSESELPGWYRRASAFMLLSVNVGRHFEGFGIVFLEAAAAGLPVIGTTGNGIADAVRGRGNGILVEQCDIEQASAAIRTVLDPETNRRFSEESRRVAHGHDLTRMIDAYDKFYRQL